ncbi:MAG: hypothetical protein J6Y29_00535 [Clostridiales bacterium]|nr:hypothetical protein [Clostridiales bacterium]
MKDFFRKILLALLIFVNNTIFCINEFVCKSNFFEKLHPSDWSWVKNLINSKFTKTCVEFFKTSCNTISNIFGFGPVFEIKVPEPRNDNLFSRVENFVGRVGDSFRQFDNDTRKWNSLVGFIEKSKLVSTQTISNFIDVWYNDIKSERSLAEKNFVLGQIGFSSSNLTNNLDLKTLKKHLNTVRSLTETTEHVLINFESLKENTSVRLLCLSKGCCDPEIDAELANIKEKHKAMKKDIRQYNYLIAKVTDRSGDYASSSNSLAPSM